MARDKLALKFQKLEQGLMTATQYGARFTQLSRYAGGLVRDEVEKTKRFVRGLRPGIKVGPMPFQFRVYIQVLEKALEVKKDTQENQEIRVGDNLL